MQVWSTEGLADSSHFVFWREVICEAFAALDPRPAARAGSFPSSVSLDRFGNVNVARITSCAQTVSRGADQIRVDPQDRLFVNLQLSGTGRVTQDGRAAVVPAGSFSIVDTTRPYRLEFEDQFEVLSLRVPREQLLPFVADPTTLFAECFGGERGMGRVAVGFMHLLLENSGSLAREQRNEVASHLCGLVASASCQGIEHPQKGLGQVRRQFVKSAIEYLQASLDDPGLGAATLANRFGVSVRYVQQAFAEDGLTVAAYIRKLRLDCCARDLANPRERSSIKAIAARWGFGDVPHFTRAFARQFGCGPASFRSRFKN
jgi:AraC-like DNA-binding protein